MRLAHCTKPILLALALLFFIAAQAHAETTHDSLYQQAGLDQQFDFLWEEIRSEYQSLPKKSPDASLDGKVYHSIEQQFSKSHIRSSVLDYWKRHLNQQDLDDIAEWLNSSAGRKLTLAEINSALLEDDTKFNAFLRSLKKQPPSKIRLELLRALDKSLHNSDASTDIGIHINLAAFTARQAAGQTPSDSLTVEQQAKSHEQDRGLIRAMMRQEVLKFNLFTYRYIDNDALRSYLQFSKSSAGAKYNESTFFAVRDAMNKATLELQRQLQGQMQHVNHASP